MDNTEISPSLDCGDSQGWTSFPTIEEVVARCELWPWSTDRFAVAVVIPSVENNNTTVGHLPREFSHLPWHFLHHGGAIDYEVTGRRLRSPLIQGGLEIPCYVTLRGKKLVSRARHWVANLPVWSIRMVIYFKTSFIPWRLKFGIPIIRTFHK